MTKVLVFNSKNYCILNTFHLQKHFCYFIWTDPMS